MSINADVVGRIAGHGSRLDALEVQERPGAVAVAILTHEEALGVHGGGITSGAWRTRTLNTERADPANIVTILSNQFTPIAGDYYIQWTAPSYFTVGHKTRLRNVTAGSNVAIGSSEVNQTTNAHQTISAGYARFTANGTDAYEIQHRVSTTNSASGQGFGFGLGGVEVYLQIILIKEGGSAGGSGGASQLTDLSDVNTATPTAGNFLRFDGVDAESVPLGDHVFLETEFLNTSAGAGDAGKPVKLDAAGHIDATMINDADIDHGLIAGLADDDHSIYALLAGRSGGQTLIGGTGSGDDLTLQSTSNATKGSIILGSASAYDEVNDRLGLGDLTPDAKLDIVIGSATEIGLIVQGAASQTAHLQEWQDSTGVANTAIGSEAFSPLLLDASRTFFVAASGDDELLRLGPRMFIRNDNGQVAKIIMSAWTDAGRTTFDDIVGWDNVGVQYFSDQNFSQNSLRMTNDSANFTWEIKATTAAHTLTFRTDFTNAAPTYPTNVLIINGDKNTPANRLTTIHTPLLVTGVADVVQNIVRGNATQTANLAEWQDSSSNIIHSTGDGLAGSEWVINDTQIDIDFRVEGENDNDLLHADASVDAVGVGIAAPLAKLHVDQLSTTGAKPVITLDQADVDEDFFKFIGTSDTNVDRALVDAADFTTPGAIVGYLKINIRDDQATNPIADGDYYIAFRAAPTA